PPLNLSNRTIPNRRHLPNPPLPDGRRKTVHRLNVLQGPLPPTLHNLHQPPRHHDHPPLPQRKHKLHRCSRSNTAPSLHYAKHNRNHFRTPQRRRQNPHKRQYREHGITHRRHERRRADNLQACTLRRQSE
ncbi:hypothetical protein DM02DRAFT_567658, partial [Periconia macrospinosa]